MSVLQSTPETLNPDLIGQLVKIQIFNKIDSKTINRNSQITVVGTLQGYSVASGWLVVKIEGLPMDKFDLDYQLVEFYLYTKKETHA